MVADNEFVNGKRTRSALDRDFYSGENLQYLTDSGYRFSIALPDSLKYCRELVNHSKFLLGPGLPYGKSCEGFRMKTHLHYNPEKALRETLTLYDLVARENDLKSMEEPPDKNVQDDKAFIKIGQQTKNSDLFVISKPLMKR